MARMLKWQGIEGTYRGLEGIKGIASACNYVKEELVRTNYYDVVVKQ